MAKFNKAKHEEINMTFWDSVEKIATNSQLAFGITILSLGLTMFLWGYDKVYGTPNPSQVLLINGWAYYIFGFLIFLFGLLICVYSFKKKKTQ